MRIFPVALCMHFTLDTDDDYSEQFLEPIHIASSLTHAHEIGFIRCGLFSLTLREWLQNTDPSKTLLDIAQSAFDKCKMTYNRMDGVFKDEINRPGQTHQPPQFSWQSVFIRFPMQISIYTFVGQDNARPRGSLY